MERIFRRLRADEIDCRVNQITEKGIVLLLYKDARVDQNILDETFGIYGWQRTHQMIDGNLYCTVSVKSPDTGEWISKQDVGTKSKTEEEKGQASDSFKRACFNLGIGRELYTAPFTFIPRGGFNEARNRKGELTTYDKFKVSEIEYDDHGNITKVVISNVSQDGKNVFHWTRGSVATVQQNKADKTGGNVKITAAHANTLEKVLKRHGKDIAAVLGFYRIDKLEDMTVETFSAIMKSLGEK